MSDREAVAIYLFLKKRESELDDTLIHLMQRIEKRLYGALSIDEFERLEELYHSGVDVWSPRE